MKTYAVLAITLSASILLSAMLVGHMFRYGVQSQGTMVLVQDRWLGTVERCVGRVSSRCYPILSAGMKAIVTPPKARAPVPAISDEEFNRLMSKADAEIARRQAGAVIKPQAGQ